MTTKFLRRASLALAITAVSVATQAEAANNYSSPSRWNNFRPTPTDDLLAEDDHAMSGFGSSSMEQLPAPSAAGSGRVMNLAAPAGNPAPQAGYSTPQYSQPAPAHMPAQSYATPAQGYTAPAPSYPAPVPSYPAPTPQPVASVYHPAPASHAQHGGYAPPPVPAQHAPAYGGSSCQSCGPAPGGSPFAAAMASPWSGTVGLPGCEFGGCGPAPQVAFNTVRPALSPWFGGANLLFLQLEEGPGYLVSTGVGDFRTSAVDPDNSVGFDVTFGRYLACGKYGVGVTLFNWNPGAEVATRTGTAGTIRAAMPGYRDVDYDYGGGVAADDNIYQHIDGTSTDAVGGTIAGATAVQLSRNLDFRGLELNLFNFGLMGARRAAYKTCVPANGCHGQTANALCGHGGAAGPLVRPCSGRLRVMTSHGFRWFQIKDSFQTAYNINGGGYGPLDIYDDTRTENNLFGYQFGGRLTYCLGKSFDLNIGGKTGIYGNRAEMYHRLGTGNAPFDMPGGTGVFETESSDTSLATLSEIDLGLGYRVTNSWSIRGGYRVIGITGVANAMQSVPQYYGSVAESGKVHADDSYILHGAYVGAEMNW